MPRFNYLFTEIKEVGMRQAIVFENDGLCTFRKDPVNAALQAPLAAEIFHGVVAQNPAGPIYRGNCGSTLYRPKGETE